MPTLRPPRVFISYSRESSEHNDRVTDLAYRLSSEGIDAMIDRYANSPREGWPAWMEKQVREADFVLVVCTEVYLRRLTQGEELGIGRGVNWESRLIYDQLYHGVGVAGKFVPVLFEAASEDSIPVPLRGLTFYRIEADYESLYRHLTGQPLVTKPPIGRLKRLSKRRGSRSSPSVFPLEEVNSAMSNPRYSEDITRLDINFDRRSVVNRETVIIVVGTTLVAELLDRPVGEVLRDRIDETGAENAFRRGIVVSDRCWFDESSALSSNAVISIGGPPANKLSAEFDSWSPPPSSPDGKYAIPGKTTLTGFYRRNPSGLPQVGLWGGTAVGTREAVEHYVRNGKGLGAFLKECWK